MSLRIRLIQRKCANLTNNRLGQVSLQPYDWPQPVTLTESVSNNSNKKSVELAKESINEKGECCQRTIHGH